MGFGLASIVGAPPAAQPIGASAESAGEAPRPDFTSITQTYRIARDSAGDHSSVLSIAGAGALFLPRAHGIAGPIIGASIVAGALDTAIQGGRWATGRPDSDAGSTLYAATGLLPAASLYWADRAVHPHGVRDGVRLALLAGNLGLVGFEAIFRGHRIEDGTESVAGYLALGAALSGLVTRVR